jgi:transposase
VECVEPSIRLYSIRKQKRLPTSDAADAQAICEVVQCPHMRFVGIKSEEQTISAMSALRKTRVE